MLNSHRGRQIFIFKGQLFHGSEDNMHPDKVPLAFGIKKSPKSFTILRDWHVVISLIAGMICMER